MTITIIPTFDPCDRPNCPEDITLEFIKYPTTVNISEEALISWRIVGTDKIPTVTKVNYSLNDALTIEEVDSTTDGEAYSTGDALKSTIPAQGSLGILYIKAEAIIGEIIYFSEVGSIVVEV